MKTTLLLVIIAAGSLLASEPKPLSDKAALELSRMQANVAQLRSEYAENYARAVGLEARIKEMAAALNAAMDAARKQSGADGCELLADGQNWKCPPKPAEAPKPKPDAKK